MQIKVYFGVFLLLIHIFAEAKLLPKSKQKIILCDEQKAQMVKIPYGRVTALNFPTSPKEVIPGESGFDFKTIRSDLVIKAMRPGASTNLLVYLEGRRCSFHLSAGTSGDEIILVRDPLDKTFEVKFYDK
jgi:hypothetical protein